MHSESQEGVVHLLHLLLVLLPVGLGLLKVSQPRVVEPGPGARLSRVDGRRRAPDVVLETIKTRL